jgi:hypothetical protein
VALIETDDCANSQLVLDPREIRDEKACLLRRPKMVGRAQKDDGRPPMLAQASIAAKSESAVTSTRSSAAAALMMSVSGALKRPMSATWIASCPESFQTSRHLWREVGVEQKPHAEVAT